MCVRGRVWPRALSYLFLFSLDGWQVSLAHTPPSFLAARLRKLGRGLLLFACGILIEGFVSCGSVYDSQVASRHPTQTDSGTNLPDSAASLM